MVCYFMAIQIDNKHSIAAQCCRVCELAEGDEAQGAQVVAALQNSGLVGPAGELLNVSCCRKVT
jgi:hypothetical protein